MTQIKDGCEKSPEELILGLFNCAFKGAYIIYDDCE
jgi:hypothetical protein